MADCIDERNRSRKQAGDVEVRSSERSQEHRVWLHVDSQGIFTPDLSTKSENGWNLDDDASSAGLSFKVEVC